VSLGVCTPLHGGTPYCLASPKNVFRIELPTAPPPNPYGERDSWELRRKKSPWPVLCAQEHFARGRENTLLPWSGQYWGGSLGQFQPLRPALYFVLQCTVFCFVATELSASGDQTTDTRSTFDFAMIAGHPDYLLGPLRGAWSIEIYL
jgi:hypothetical protein